MKKQRGSTRRAWVKLYVTGWLHGSIRWQLEPEERSVWADLLCLAGECSQNGLIADNDGRGFPRQYVANHLNIPLELLESTISKCQVEGRIDNREDGVLQITNWQIYQSEYERLKKYRQPKPINNGDKPENLTKVLQEKTKSLQGERVREVFARIDKIRGYRPPKRQAEAASIMRMLKTYTTDQIIDTYEKLKAQPFWADKELFLMSIESQIGAVINGETRGNNQKPGRTPRREEYTRPEELQHIEP